ncbi:SufS family cysteine desulfurase [Candidatus Uhrbacteria bacterium]|nr:SufS family cysteine desulfurase [Candidatus Uhrbacteria bacterium]
MTIETIKKEFPIFSRRINGKPLVYLDNASTSQKPSAVLDALTNFYTTSNANIHRGIHTLSEEATERYEATRKSVARFINAAVAEEIVFTKNCTESINLVARTWGHASIRRGDHILVSALEHHANLIPWQELARKKHAKLFVIPLTSSFELDMEAYDKLLSRKTKIVCVTTQSNVIGTRPPMKEMIKKAHAVGARVMVDGAQSVGHQRTDVVSMGCDFFAFSAHKMLGPTGVGVLYADYDILETLQPFLYGGDMVTSVEREHAVYRDAPWRFEAGTPNIADVVAFRAAIEFLEEIGMDTIESHDARCVAAAREALAGFARVRVFAPESGASCVAFTVDGIHPHDVATIFNSEGVAIRSGLHCAEPLVKDLGVPALSRMSFYLYNTMEDVAVARQALEKVFRIFSLTSNP